MSPKVFTKPILRIELFNNMMEDRYSHNYKVKKMIGKDKSISILYERHKRNPRTHRIAIYKLYF